MTTKKKIPALLGKRPRRHRHKGVKWVGAVTFSDLFPKERKQK